MRIGFDGKRAVQNFTGIDGPVVFERVGTYLYLRRECTFHFIEKAAFFFLGNGSALT